MKLFSKKSEITDQPEPNKIELPVVESGEEEEETIRGSFTKLSLPFIVSGIFVPLLMATIIYSVILSPLVNERNDTVTNIYTDAYSRLIEMKLQELELLGSTLSELPSLKDAVLDSSTLDTSELMRQTGLPSLLSINLLLPNNLKPNLDVSPPINFAAIELVRRTIRKEKVFAEVHRVDEKWILRYATPIGGDEEEAQGALLLNLDFKEYMAKIPSLGENIGLLRLTQQFSTGEAKEVWQQGNSRWANSSDTSSSFLKNNNLWTLHFSASKNLAEGSYNQNLFLGIAGAGIILALLLSLVSHALLSRSLNNNSEAFFDFIDRLASRGVNIPPKYTLTLFDHLSTTLGEIISNARTRLVSQTANEYAAVGKGGEGSSVLAQDSGRAQGDDIMLDPLFQNQDALDIDMNEEDENLLNVNMTDENHTMTTSTDHIPDSIFRAYDIRGIVGETLTADVVFKIGQAIGSEALAQGEHSIAVARDGRLSGPELIEMLVAGLVSTGCNVINIGMEPTPVLYYAANTLDTRSGVMLTGSHNPANYNGLKIVINGHTLSGDEIQNLKQRIINNDFEEGNGNAESVNITADYIERIVSDVVLARPMKIVIDCGNGVPGAVAPALFTALGCEVTSLYCEVDGEFPNHHPDPSKPENLQDLIHAVQSTGADIGLAFDGDGDRIGVVTPSGKIIFSDRLLMLYARDLLSRNPGADIIFDVKCTRDLVDLISSLGGRAIMWKTGHSFIKAKLKETGAVIAGEMSGHIFFNDRWYGFDDALYSGARLLEILSMETMDADEVFAEFPEKPTTPEINIPVTEESKFKIVEDLQRFSDFEDGRINTIDGVRVDFPDCWGLVRASNTTPVLVARFEANDEELLEKIKTMFRNNLLHVDSSLDLPF